jgi:cytochrome b561
MSVSQAASYRSSQIWLHWIVFLAVAFLFVTGDTTTERYFADLHAHASEVPAFWIPLHAIVGIAILLAVLARLWLRIKYGAPPPPESEPAPLRLLAHAVHYGLYIDLIVGGLVGIPVYFGMSSLVGMHNLLTRLVLIVLVVPHVLGAFWHHFYWRDDVLKRMIRPGTN